MVLMGRRLGSYGCMIQNGEKMKTELIKIPMVDLPLGAMKNCVCPFGGSAWTTCCACATTAVVVMTRTNAVTLTVAVVMVMAKVGTMTTAMNQPDQPTNRPTNLPTYCQNNRPTWQRRGRALAAARRRWQKRGGSAATVAAVATTTMIKMKATAVAANWQQCGSSGGRSAAALAWRWWQWWLDRPPHDLTPLPVQAGEDAAGVHPAPTATTTLF